MADYNKNYMAAYKQYADTMTAGGGGTNLSGAGSSTMQVWNYGNDDQPSGLGAPTTKPKEEKKSENFWDRITNLFTSNDVDVTNVYKPSVNPASVYDSDAFNTAKVEDYVYRAQMSEQTQDMVEQAMGFEKTKLGQLQLLDTRAMTEEEKERLGPLLDLADDISNENIKTTELPPIEGEQQSSLMDALMEGQPTAGLMQRPSVFTGQETQIASTLPDWMQALPLEGFSQALIDIREGRIDRETGQPILQEEEEVVLPAAETPEPTVDPETGQTIKSADDVANERMAEMASQGLMSRRQDTKGQIETTKLVADKYLRDKQIIDDDTTISLDAAVSDTDFEDRTKAMGTLETAVKNAYDSAITSQAILTTIGHESGSRLIEGTNYTRGRAIAMLGGGDEARIAEINELYGDRNRLTPEEQEELLNIAYGGRMGNANDEGFKYRGRGLIQITGKDNYRAVGEALGIGDALVDNPDLLLEDPALMLAATDAYLTSVKGMNRDEPLTANGLKDMIGHSGSRPAGFNGTGSAYAGMQRWNEVVTELENEGKLAEAEEARLNNEFTAQQTVGAYVDGDIGPNSIALMRQWLSSNGIPVPRGASAMDLVVLVNENS